MKKILLLFFVVAVVLTIIAWLRYGGGQPYPNLAPAPRLSGSALEEVLVYPEPVGNVAVSAAGRLLFTVHPEARPQGNKLLEFVAGASVPYPDGAAQAQLFDTPLGVAIDAQNRLWTIDHGNHGLRKPRLLAFDLTTDEIVHGHVFDAAVAPAGSFLQDLQVSRDGRTVVVADTSFWRKRPALIVYDLKAQVARRVLESHPSVAAEDYVIRNHGKEMTFAGGIVALRGGVDGIALGPEWLYYGAISGSGLYRIALADLRNATLPPAQLGARVERYATKPLSDGLSLDNDGNVYGTDVEHGAIFRVDTGQQLETLLRSGRIRWPDALSFGPGGWLYVADSDLASVILKSRKEIEANGPYRIFRFRPGAAGVPGR